MSESCIFCKIVKKLVSTNIIYEDNKNLAFLDIRPVNEGHTLIIPKKHYKNIHELPEEEITHLFKNVKKIANAVKKGVKADGITIVQNNGVAAGQVIFHLHVHIIPSHLGQEKHRPRMNIEEKKLAKVATKIKNFF